MPAQPRYLSSILTYFSTFLSKQRVDDTTAAQAAAACLRFLHWKEQFSSWDPEETCQYLSNHQTVLDPNSPAAQVLVQFVKQFQPVQTNTYLHEYLLALRHDGCSDSTIRNYRSDIKQFIEFTDVDTVKELFIKPKLVKFVKSQLEKGLKTSSITRKVASITQFGLWAQHEELIGGDLSWLNYSLVTEDGIRFDQAAQAEDEVARIPVSQTGEASRSPEPAETPLGDEAERTRAAKTIKTTQPSREPLHQLRPLFAQSLKSFNNFSSGLQVLTQRSIMPYVNLALVALFFLGLGYFGFSQVFRNVSQPLAYPDSPVTPNRVLSFQGRLTDSAQNPITTETDIRFYLYDQETLGSILWDSGDCPTTPDQDGIFATGLGEDCGGAIDPSVFTENANVWLEVEVETETLEPRQPIRTVAYALNAETVQGYPITASGAATVNTLLTMNEWGEIVLGEDSPAIKSGSGTFTLEGQSLLLQTSTGSDGDIVFDADGLGGVISQDYFSAPGATISATYAEGIALVLKGGPTGTGDIQQWQDSAGGVLGVVDESGNLGIGTTNPSQALEINDNVTNGGFVGTKIVETGLSGKLLAGIYKSPTGAWDVSGLWANTDTPTAANASFLSDNSGNTYFNALTGQGLYFQINNSNKMTVASTGNVGIGDTSPASLFTVGDGDKFRVDADGQVMIGNLASDPTAIGEGSIYYNTGDDKLYYYTAAGWTAVGSDSGGGTLWRISEGAISPANDTLDFLLGSTATESARFAVLNIDTNATNPPVATISAGVDGATYLTADGILSTTAQQTLTLGTATTGDINLAPDGTSLVYLTTDGNVGIGDTSPDAKLDIESATEQLRLTYSPDPTNDFASFTVDTNGDLAIVPNGADTRFTSDVEPTVGSTYDLGTFSNTWQALYVDTVNGTTVNATTVAATTITQDGNAVCDSSGNCTAAGWWDNTENVLRPISEYAGVVDLAIGGDSTASARFQVQGLTGDITKIGGVAHTITDEAGNLRLTSASDVLEVAATTLQLVSGSTSLDVYSAAADTLLSLSNTDGTYVASLSVEGQVQVGNFAADPTAVGEGSIYYNTGDDSLYYYTSAGWSAVGSGSGSGGSLWRINEAAISPINDHLDLLLGSDATASAKIGLINIGDGVPTATIAGTTTDVATYLTGEGVLGTTNQQTLTVGGADTGDLAFSPNGATRMYINQDGEVGIGTTNPTTQAHIYDSALISKDLLTLDSGFNDTSEYLGLKFHSNNRNIDARISAVIGAVGASSRGTELGFWTQPADGGTLTEVMRLSQDGNLGIGITDPTSKLHLVGAITGKALAIFDELGDQDIFTASSGGITRFRIASNGYTYAQRFVDLANSNYYIDPAASDIALAVLGKSGMGVATPEHQLQVEGGITGKALVSFNETGDQDIFTASSGGETKLVLSNDGKLGVGGDITPTAGITVGSSDAGAAWATGTDDVYIQDDLEVDGTIYAQIFGSDVGDGASAVGFTFNTTNTLSTAGAKLLSLQNNTTEMFYVDKDGNVWAKGSIYADRGFGIQMKNIGVPLSQYDLVVINTTEDAGDGVPRMSATTSAYTKTAFGVVQTTCAYEAVCNVVFQGKSLINVDDSTDAGDYLFSSTTAGKATSATKQYDGLIGIATSADAAAPYQVEMVFLHQPAVSKLRVADKNRMHNDYHEAAVDYDQATSESTYYLTDENIRKGLYFDTFKDGAKIDTNTSMTVAQDLIKQRTGLWGGVTLNATNTDTSGNTYLGSADANDVWYTDRTQTGDVNAHQDSTAQTLVDLGIDPYWYNGVTLDASASATLATSPPTNLSTTYNGRLIKVSGRYATGEEDGPILITILSDNEATESANPSLTFNWRSNGHSGTANHSGSNITVNKGTAYTLETGTNDIDITFTNTRYHAGDIFKIASWYLEPETANDRGEKQAFPQRANIVAQGSYVDILDADTNKLWMRFGQGTDYLLGVDADNNPSSVYMINGTLYVGTNGSSATGMYQIEFYNDSAIKYNSTAAFGYTDYLQSRNTDPGDAYHNDRSNTALAIVANTVNDVHAAPIPNEPTGKKTLTGWGWGGAAGAQTTFFENLFVDIPTVVAEVNGYKATQPFGLDECTTVTASTVNPYNVTSRYFYMYENEAGRCYSWAATGTVAPHNVVAVGTDDGATVIRSHVVSSGASNGHTSDIYYDANWEQVKKLWLSTNGELYYALKHNTNDTWRMWKKNHTLSWYGDYTTNYTLDVPYDNLNSGVGPAINQTYDLNDIYVTENTSTINPDSNSVFVSHESGLSVIQEYTNGQQSYYNNSARYSNREEFQGSIKNYTKDYFSEEMVGDVRGMWPLDAANSSADLEDVSVNGFNLTATNIDSNDAVSGVRGMATDFDGSTEYLSCADGTCGGASGLDPASAMSISAWIKPSAPANNQLAVMKGASLALGIGFTGGTGCTSGKFGFSTYDGGWDCASGSTSAQAGQWYHLVGTSDGSNIRLYVNGQLEGITAQGHIDDSAFSFDVGGYSGDMATYGFPGVIDEVMFTAETLTPNQIKRIYETGKRALQSHSINDFKNNLDEDGTGNGSTSIVQATAVQIDPQTNFGPYAYVAANDTTAADDGWINKIDLSSDTVIQSYRTTTDPAIPDNDATSLAVSASGLELVGMDGIGAVNPGLSAQGNNQTGTLYSKTVSLPDNISSAYAWVSSYIDPDCATCSITVEASNNGGSSYVTGTLLNTDSNQSLPEKEYLFSFDNPGNSLKFKVSYARDSDLDANIYIEKYGVAWFNDDDAVGGTENGGLFTSNSTSVANGDYIELTHNQNTNDLVANGWFFDAGTGTWKDIATATESGTTTATSATVIDGEYLEYTGDQDATGWYQDADGTWKRLDEQANHPQARLVGDWLRDHGPDVYGYNAMVTSLTIGDTTHVYKIGGYTTSARTTVSKAVLNSDGSLGGWDVSGQTQFPVGIAMGQAYATTVGGVNYIYTIGGLISGTGTTAVYRATIDSNGNVGTWSTTGQTALPAARYHTGFDHLTLSGTEYLYIIGGTTNGTTNTNTVYQATIDGSGNITGWTTTGQSQFPYSGYYFPVTIANVSGSNYIYAVGGYINGSGVQTGVYKSPIDGSGNITAWTAVGQTQLPVARGIMQIYTQEVAGTDYVYIAGGYLTGGTSTAAVERAALDASGNIGSFSTTNQDQLPEARRNAASGNLQLTASDGTTWLYYIGGYSDVTAQGHGETWRSSIDGSGNVNDWVSSSMLIRAIGTASTTVEISGTTYLYTLGGLNGSTYLSAVYKSTLDANGNVVGLTTTNQEAMPAGRYLHTANIANINGTNYIYVVGGHSGTYQSTVWRATIDTNGDISGWTTTGQTQLSFTLGYQQTHIATFNGTTYIYLVGGVLNGTNSAAVYRATIDSSGNIGAWATTNQDALPAGMYGHSSVLHQLDDNNAYIFSCSGVVVSSYSTSCYRSDINSHGNVVDWTTTTSLPSVLAYAAYGKATIGGKAYFFILNGYNGSAYTQTSYVAPINTDGELGDWQDLGNNHDWLELPDGVYIAPYSRSLATPTIDGITYLYITGAYSNASWPTTSYAFKYTLTSPFPVTQPSTDVTRFYNFSGEEQTLRYTLPSTGFRVEQTDTNTVRLYNYSGSTQNLRLDVIAGSLTGGSSVGGVSLAPIAADVDPEVGRSSIWINKTDETGRLLRLQNDSLDRFSVGWDGHATLSGNLTVGNALTLTPSSTATTTTEGSVYYDSDTDHLFVRTGDAAWHRLAMDMTQYSDSNAALAHEGTLTVTHNQNTYDVLATGWENSEHSDYRQISEPQGADHHATDANLVGWWKMDEASGNLTDESAMGNTLIAKGTPTYSVAGKVDGGDAIDFNGTTDYFCTGSGTTCADDDDFDFAGDFSVGAWIKTDDLTSNGMVIASKYNTTDSIFIMYTGSNVIQFQVFQTNSDNTFLNVATTTDYITNWDDTKWHFITGTVTGNTAQLYVDGQLIASDTTTAGTRDTSSAAPFMIGQDTVLPAGYYYNGSMDDVFAYSRSLTMEEIRELYQYGTKRYKINTPTANTVRLTNLSGANQNVRLDVVVQGADLAEWYPTSDMSLEAADLVSIDESGQKVNAVRKSIGTSDPQLIGVVSTKAGKELSVPGPDRRLVALVGRVPVKISPHSAPIKIGDHLTSSDIPGLAQKATQGGAIVGQALESWNPGDDKSQIMIFLKLGNYEPQISINDYGLLNMELVDDASQSAEMSQDATPSATLVGSTKPLYTIRTAAGETITKLGAFSQATIGNLTAGAISVKDIATDRLTIAGQTIEEFINAQIEQYLAERGLTDLIGLSSNSDATTSSQLAELLTPATDNDVVIQLPADQTSSDSAELDRAGLTITNASGSAVARIDSQGNTSLLGNLVNAGDITTFGQLSAREASIAGQTTTQDLVADTATIQSSRMEQLEAKMAQLERVKAQTAELVNATISGTLYANQIDGFDDKVANSLKQPSLLSQLMQEDQAEEASRAASLASLFQVVNSSSFTTTPVATMPASLASLNKELADLQLNSTDLSLQASAIFVNDYFKVNGAAFVAQSLGIGQELLVSDGMKVGQGFIEYQPSELEMVETDRDEDGDGILDLVPAKPLLKIQPSGVGTLSLMAGLMTLDETGQVTITGDLTVDGKLRIKDTLLTNLLEPDDYANPFQLKLATLSGQVAGASTDEELQQSRFEIVNETGTPVATISAQGRAEFSSGLGVGTVDLMAESAASTSAAVSTDKTSGKATIRTGHTALTIQSPLITERSLIYINPISSTHNQVLYIKSQIPEDPTTLEPEGRFVVGFDSPVPQDVSFNWWIVN